MIFFLSAIRPVLAAFATITVLSVSVPANASTVDFDFSFTDGTDTVSGTIFGLAETGVSQASRLIASGGALGPDLIEFIAPSNPSITLFSNNFLVAGGQITAFEFSSRIDFPSASVLESPIIAFLSLADRSAADNFAGAGIAEVLALADFADVFTVANPGFPTFTLREPAVSAVPLPAALPLMAGGISLLGFMGWRRKKAGQA